MMFFLTMVFQAQALTTMPHGKADAAWLHSISICSEALSCLTVFLFAGTSQLEILSLLESADLSARP